MVLGKCTVSFEPCGYREVLAEILLVKLQTEISKLNCLTAFGTSLYIGGSTAIVFQAGGYWYSSIVFGHAVIQIIFKSVFSNGNRYAGCAVSRIISFCCKRNW